MPAHWRTGCKGVYEVFIGRHQKATSSTRVSLANGDKINGHHDEGGWQQTSKHTRLLDRSIRDLIVGE